MKKLKHFAVGILAIAVSMGTVGIAHAFNPQPDPPGAEEYTAGDTQMEVTLANLTEDDVCEMDVNVIAYFSPGETVLTERVVLNPGDAMSLNLTRKLDEEIKQRRREAERNGFKLTKAPLVRVRIEVPEEDNVGTFDACGGNVVVRLAIRKEGRCRLCAPLPSHICSTARSDCQPAYGR